MSTFDDAKKLPGTAAESKMDRDYDHILNIDYDREFCQSTLPGDTFITTASRVTQKLDGQWKYAIDVYDTGIRKKFYEEVDCDEQGRKLPVDFDFEDWEDIMLPQNWNVHKPELLYYEGTVLFVRNFRYLHRENKRIFLKIGAANYETRVWINQKYVERHIGGYTPFFMEITDYLKEENRIYLMVNNTRKREAVPSLNFDWYNYGGVFRSIELIELPQSFIRNFFVHLVPDDAYNKIAVRVWIENIQNSCPLNMEIPELNISCEIPVTNGVAQGTISCDNIELWCPQNPKLYEVQISYNGETIHDQIGFRQIKSSGNNIYLNGKDTYFYGMSAHEEKHLRGRTLSEGEMRDMFAQVKELGCNYMRLAHYPHHPLMAKIADEVGILLWEEIPVYWALEFTNPQTFACAKNQLTELMLRDHNRASVVIWGIGNENPDTDERLLFMKNLAMIVREHDSSRLVAAACLVNIDTCKIQDRLREYVDIVGINEYYGWYYRDFAILEKICEQSDIGKPVFVSETGAGALAGHHGTNDDLFTEEYQAFVYSKQFEILFKTPYIRGISPWILYDFRTMVRLNRYQRGYNRKGLINADRNYKKQAYYVVKKYYCERNKKTRCPIKHWKEFYIGKFTRVECRRCANFKQ